MRGEYMSAASNITSAPGSPPLARGILRMPPQGCQENRITPACAGNTREATGATATIRDHPRLRGEYFRSLSDKKRTKGSPPLARGIPSSAKFHTIGMGITPACAGNTPSSDSQPPESWDHPRLRGEYSFDSAACSLVWGSPPLARGIQLIPSWRVASIGITPACAGNT